MRDTLELPRLSLRERDRRWAAVRKDMAARDLDCLVLWGWPLMWDFCIANARYLCPVGGNAEFNVLVFPRQGDPTCFVLMPTFLEGWRSAQAWVGDIRARKGTWADSVAERIKELKLERGRIGMDGLAGPLDPDGWVPQRLSAPAGASARRQARASRRHAGEGAHHQKRRRARHPRQGGGARRPDAGGVPRHRATWGQGMRGLRPHGGNHAGARRRGADLVSVGLRPLSLPASVPRADHAQARARRRHHLRAASEDRRLFHPCRAHLLPRRAGGQATRDL